MPHLHAEPLRRLVSAIFAKSQSQPDEAALIARRLVDANLVGHDSHGIVRVPAYIRWLGEGKVVPNQHVRVITESDAFAILDGRCGYGQVIGGEAMDIGMAKAAKTGVAMVSLRHVHHLGRIGDWAEHCAAKGVVSVHFVNGVHLGWIVAPFGGIERRMTTNPFCCGMPVEGGEPIILDMATSKIAEGKNQVARNKGIEVPPGALIDAQGKETRDPNALYASPAGALLPFGDHKGYGLAVFCDLLAGALGGGGANHDGHANKGQVLNNMLSILIDPGVIGATTMNEEVTRFIAWLKSSAPRDGEVMVPGDPERRSRTQRERDGIPVDEKTWSDLLRCAAESGLADAEVKRLLAA
jgi:uncharacterized oxidoreductase